MTCSQQCHHQHHHRQKATEDLAKQDLRGQKSIKTTFLYVLCFCLPEAVPLCAFAKATGNDAICFNVKVHFFIEIRNFVKQV